MEQQSIYCHIRYNLENGAYLPSKVFTWRGGKYLTIVYLKNIGSLSIVHRDMV